MKQQLPFRPVVCCQAQLAASQCSSKELLHYYSSPLVSPLECLHTLQQVVDQQPHVISAMAKAMDQAVPLAGEVGHFHGMPLDFMPQLL